jgi:pteridine reductase
MDLTDRVVIVTGAAKRVGRRIALHLAEHGCDIAFHYGRSAREAEAVAELIRGKGRRASTIAADLRDADAPQRIVDHALAEHGRIDALVNNAATFPTDPLGRIERGAFEDVLQVDLIAPVLLAQAVWPVFRRAGAGKIVNLVDIYPERGLAERVPYCAAKAGLISATRSLALAMGPIVQVNGVAPGVALFPDEMPEADREAIVAKVPLGRKGTPDDIAAAVRFLLAEGDYVTGQILTVDGGRSVMW